MDNQEPQKKKKDKASRGSRVNALVILICIDLIGFMASLYVLKAAKDANLYLIPAALTLVMSVITAMVYVQMRHQDEENRQRIAGDVADALSAIIQITKNDQQMMDKKIEDLSEEYKVPAQEIINALKALAKVSLGRSKENATALINSNETVVAQVMDLQDKIDSLEKTVDAASNNDLSKVIDDNSHKVAVGLDDLTHDVQRLDQDMRRLERVAKDMEIHAPVIQSVQTQPAPAEKNEKDIPSDPDLYDNSKELNEETTCDEPYVQANAEEAEVKPAALQDESDDSESDDIQDLSSELEPPADDETETATDEDLTSLLDAVPEDTDDVETGNDDLDLTIDDESEDQEIGPDDLSLDLDEPASEPADESVAEEAVAEEAEAEPSEEPELSIEPESTPEPEEEQAAEPEPTPEPEEEQAAEAEPVSEPEPVQEVEPEPAPASDIDLSDPNKKLSPDEIAALFAQATKSPEPASEEEPVIDEQPVSEKNVPDDTPAGASGTDSDNAEAAPAPDTDGDPNRMMTPEEIEALFSNVS